MRRAKRIVSLILAMLMLLMICENQTRACNNENVWSNTENYKNCGGYTDTDLIDRTFFASIIGVSDSYLVLPLYNLQDCVSAYVIQYYSEGIPLSYVVVNTSVSAEDAYYIEFGCGDFARVLGLYNVEEEESIRACYCGGSQYYIETDDKLYHFAGELDELDSEIRDELEERTSGVYYNFGETLTQAAVFNKEVGYDTYSVYTRLTSFTKRTMGTTQYAYGTNNPITNHCAPTAGINFMQYLYSIEGKTSIPMGSWQSVFIALHTAMGTSNLNGTADSSLAPAYQSVLRSYGYNSATSSIQYSASWNQVISALGSNAVHLCLHDSEIYGNHSVLSVGYIYFSHSTGWVSKYYTLVDGWTADIRYVHSSLGIDHINLVTVYVGY